jgi:hypothetical protein
MLLRIDTVNRMSKTPKNHPQTMAHQYYAPRTLSFSYKHMFPDRGVKLVLAPQSPNFYPSNVVKVPATPSSFDLGAVSKTCVLRIPTARVTNEEREAFHQGRSRNSAAKITLHGRALRPQRPPTPGSFSRLPFCIATWINCPRNFLTSTKHVPRFSLWQMDGRSRNGRPFPLGKSLTLYGLLTVPIYIPS